MEVYRGTPLIVKLQEEITQDASGEYLHQSTARMFRHVDSPPFAVTKPYFRKSDRPEPLTQRTLVGVVEYLEREYKKTLFEINNTTIQEPTKAKEIGPDTYESEFMMLNLPSHPLSTPV
jgi:hypothetical protein